MSKSDIRVALGSSFLFAALMAAEAAQAQVDRRPVAASAASEAGQPLVRVRRDGSGTVDLRNGCIVAYNWFGTRISGTGPCTPAMRAQADRIFRAST